MSDDKEALAQQLAEAKARAKALEAKAEKENVVVVPTERLPAKVAPPVPQEIIRPCEAAQTYDIVKTDSPTVETLAANLDGQALTQFDLMRIKIPSGGGLAWEIPAADGGETPDTVKTWEGIVLATHMRRAYWREAYSGAGSPPDCESMDCAIGVGDPGGSCKRCPFAQFGSAVNADGSQGAGQACKQIQLLFVYREVGLLPDVVALPPTSLKAWRSYTIHTCTKRLRAPYWHVLTAFGLEKAQSKGGITYSKATFKSGGRLSPEQAANLDQARRRFEPMLKTVATERDDAGDAMPSNVKDAQVVDSAGDNLPEL